MMHRYSSRMANLLDSGSFGRGKGNNCMAERGDLVSKPRLSSQAARCTHAIDLRLG